MDKELEELLAETEVEDQITYIVMPDGSLKDQEKMTAEDWALFPQDDDPDETDEAEGGE